MIRGALGKVEKLVNEKACSRNTAVINSRVCGCVAGGGGVVGAVFVVILWRVMLW